MNIGLCLLISFLMIAIVVGLEVSVYQLISRDTKASISEVSNKTAYEKLPDCLLDVQNLVAERAQLQKKIIDLNRAINVLSSVSTTSDTLAQCLFRLQANNIIL